MQPGTSAGTLLPMVTFQNMSQGPPSSLLQVAVKNNQQPVWYFNDKISLHVFFTEDGRMERANFLEVKSSCTFWFPFNFSVRPFASSMLELHVLLRYKTPNEADNHCWLFVTS